MVYGPQKGAPESVARELDAALRHFATVAERQMHVRFARRPGMGAGGGMGAGVVLFLGGALRRGVELVADVVRLDERVAGADLVITGEGRIDGQTARGKTPVGVARVAKRHDVPVIALAGSLGPRYAAVYKHDIDAVFSICPGPIALAEAMADGARLLQDTVERVARLWKACGTRRAKCGP
jgi:glycerate kinase